MEDEGQGEETPVEMPADAAQYLNEMKKHALTVMFPHPNELKKRLPFIGNYRGRAPNLTEEFGAMAEIEIGAAIELKRRINWAKIDPVEFISTRSVSINRGGRKEAVEIARAQPVETRRSLIDRFLGR